MLNFAQNFELEETIFNFVYFFRLQLLILTPNLVNSNHLFRHQNVKDFSKERTQKLHPILRWPLSHFGQVTNQLLMDRLFQNTNRARVFGIIDLFRKNIRQSSAYFSVYNEQRWLVFSIRGPKREVFYFSLVMF